MRKIIRITFVAAVLAGLMSCSKTPLRPSGEDKYFVNITDSVFFNSDLQFKEYICHALADFPDPDLKATVINLVFALSAKVSTSDGIRFSKYNFRYLTKDVSGNDVVLSATMMVPTRQGGIHEVEAATLLNNYMILPSRIASRAGSEFFLRAMFNQVVVIPDGEGIGDTYEERQHQFVASTIHARQAIDCELAALEALNHVGVYTRRGFKTYNMAVSKGAPVSMMVQKMLESSEPAEVKAKINLASTYCCAGPYDLLSILESAVATDVSQHLYLPVMMAYGAYYGYPSLFRDYRLKDFFTPSFNAASLADVVGRMTYTYEQMEEIFTKVGIYSVSDLYNGRMFTSDGELNMSDSLTIAFAAALDSYNTAKGWKPRTPLLMEHSDSDDLVPYTISYNCYEQLRGVGSSVENEKVSQNTYYGLDHNSMSAIGIARIMILENPCNGLLNL